MLCYAVCDLSAITVRVFEWFAPECWMHKRNLVATDLNHSLACSMVVVTEVFFERWKIISIMHKLEGLLFLLFCRLYSILLFIFCSVCPVILKHRIFYGIKYCLLGYGVQVICNMIDIQINMH